MVDTNIILHHLEVLKRFVGDVERMNLPVVVVVPGAVTLELDRWVFFLKKRVASLLLLVVN